ncbi:unnamed protein product [Phyllotreta striolata]|uniref:CUB domain-containing protein n=1 Tax=Phyllotreta striolata TaxID=444603 RepID=A0A9N9XR72_PHYSR|nr:unnamed protein product [Phyllotreta striolata]
MIISPVISFILLNFLYRKGISAESCVNSTDCDYQTTTTETINTFETPTTLEPQYSTLPFRSLHLPIQPKIGSILPQCCLNTYNSRRFLITSPGFPRSISTKHECVIRIQKSNQNICRLRLNFLYFYLGSSTYNNCPSGYLSIDNKLICGCNKELKLTTIFEKDGFKNLIFKSEGTVSSSYTGFVIEAIQDECPKKYYPAGNRNLNVSSKYFDDRLNVEIERAQLIHQRTEILGDKSSKFIGFPGSIKTYYYFSEPNDSGLPLEPKESEPATFIDTSTINSIVTNLNSYECINWNNQQINGLLYRNLETCRRVEENTRIENSNCLELDYLKGYFKSPGYPFFYPKNLNVCYRFVKQTGYCGVRILFADFQIENSYGCSKDFVLLDNRSRYCGKGLCKKHVSFDLTYRNFVDVKFVTDQFFCGRGFFGLFEQIPCRIIPTDPPDFPTTTIRPTPVVCDRFVDDKTFVLEVTVDAERCVFQIRRMAKDVCKINLYLEQFDLFCGAESLLVNNMPICGRLTGRKISVSFEENNGLIQLIYQSTLANKYQDFKFRILGEQIDDDCLYPDVPAQLLKS